MDDAHVASVQTRSHWRRLSGPGAVSLKAALHLLASLRRCAPSEITTALLLSFPILSATSCSNYLTTYLQITFNELQLFFLWSLTFKQLPFFFHLCEVAFILHLPQPAV